MGPSLPIAEGLVGARTPLIVGANEIQQEANGLTDTILATDWSPISWKEKLQKSGRTRLCVHVGFVRNTRKNYI